MQSSLVPVGVLLAVFALPESAWSARFPVIIGNGVAIAFVDDLPANAPLVVGQEKWSGDRPTKVGYKYYRRHIFWAPIWTYTSGGEFVAYNDAGFLTTTYIPLGTNLAKVGYETNLPKWK